MPLPSAKDLDPCELGAIRQSFVETEIEGGRYAGSDVWDITSRTLTVIVPSWGTMEQRQVLRQIVEAGRQRGVMVRIEVHR